jgi:hypothetical protein
MNARSLMASAVVDRKLRTGTTASLDALGSRFLVLSGFTRDGRPVEEVKQGQTTFELRQRPSAAVTEMGQH